MSEEDVVLEVGDVAAPEEGEVGIPATLPVLPLKETVVFPEAVAPLAVASRARCA